MLNVFKVADGASPKSVCISAFFKFYISLFIHHNFSGCLYGNEM
jgi:hypothetical protein